MDGVRITTTIHAEGFTGQPFAHVNVIPELRDKDNTDIITDMPVVIVTFGNDDQRVDLVMTPAQAEALKDALMIPWYPDGSFAGRHTSLEVSANGS